MSIAYILQPMYCNNSEWPCTFNNRCIVSDNECTESFELAPPVKEFGPYTTAVSKETNRTQRKRGSSMFGMRPVGLSSGATTAYHSRFTQWIGTMTIDNTIPFTITDWDAVASENHRGEKGNAVWKMLRFGNIRVRKVEYSPGYCADHWCDKGHIIYCIEGEMTTELKDGRKFVLKKGMSYQVGDNADSHRSFTETGVSLFIVD